MESYIHTFPLLYIHCPTGPDFRFGSLHLPSASQGTKKCGQKKVKCEMREELCFPNGSATMRFQDSGQSPGLHY